MTQAVTGNPAEVVGLEAGKPKLTPHDVPKICNIQTGKVDATWAQYGIYQAEALLGDRPTGYKLVIKHEKPISFVSTKYVLIPNELAVEAGDIVARQLGAKPFHEFRGPWAIKPNSHVLYYGYENSKVKAFYAFDEAVDVDGRGDKVYVGFMLSNAIDGSGCLGFGTFTFRFACQNMFWMKPWAMSQWHENLGRKALSWARQVHLGNRVQAMASESLDALVAAAKAVVDHGLKVQERLKAMVDEKAIIDKVEKMVKALPLKYLSQLPWVNVVKTDGKNEVMIEDTVLSDMTSWDVFNDITRLIWHDSKQGVETKESYMTIVQRAMF